MKIVRVTGQLLGLHPRFMLMAVPLLVLSSFVAVGSIVGLAPIIDLMIQSSTRVGVNKKPVSARNRVESSEAFKGLGAENPISS